VVLPEHLHCVIELPPGDADFATRRRLIKIAFSKALPVAERRSQFAWLGVNAAYGNAAIGNIGFAMRRISVHTWIMCTSIRLSMV
jgi:REP element-mobilizing transposase RayT